MKRIFVLLLSVLAVLSLCSCGKEDDRPIIAVSIVPQATFVEKVCGDNFKVVTMIPSGASTATYEPSPREMTALSDAVVYFSIGVPAEENYIINKIEDPDKIVSLHATAETIYPYLEIDGARDPHLWLSPKRVIVMVEEIAETLCKIDPDNEEEYRENAKKYCAELEKLDSEITELLKDKAGQSFMVFHPSFGYFADDYSLTQYALEKNGKEADAKNLAKMSDLAKKEGIKAVFYQAESSSRQAEAFAEEIGGKAIELSPLSPDYTKNLLKMAKIIAEAIN